MVYVIPPLIQDLLYLLDGNDRTTLLNELISGQTSINVNENNVNTKRNDSSKSFPIPSDLKDYLDTIPLVKALPKNTTQSIEYIYDRLCVEKFKFLREILNGIGFSQLAKQNVAEKDGVLVLDLDKENSFIEKKNHMMFLQCKLMV